MNHIDQQNSKEDLDKLVEAHIPLVRRIAKKTMYSSNLFEEGDLVSIGTFGLIQAAERFDPSQGFKFESYAAQRISGAMLDEMRKLDPVPDNHRRAAKNIKSAALALEQKLCREPTAEEIAAEADISLEKYHATFDATRFGSLVSLDAPMSGDDGEEACLQDFLEDRESIDPEKQALSSEMHRLLQAAVKRLPDREQSIIDLLYRRDLTLGKIGEALNLSEARICQLHKRAIQKLECIMKEDNAKPAPVVAIANRVNEAAKETRSSRPAVIVVETEQETKPAPEMTEATEETEETEASEMTVIEKIVIRRKWQQGYLLTQKTAQETGSPNVPLNYVSPCGFKLGRWQYEQKRYFKQNVLPEKKVDLLNGLNFAFGCLRSYADSFAEGVGETSRYAQTTGSAVAPFSYVTEDGYKLGAWQNKQRQYYNAGTLPQEKIQALEAVGFEWPNRRRKVMTETERVESVEDSYMPKSIIPNGITDTLNEGSSLLLRIEVDEHSRVRIWKGGEEVKNVRSASFMCGVDMVPSLDLSLNIVR